MELREFQKRTIAQIERYMAAVAEERAKGNTRHASLDAWNALAVCGLDGKRVPYRERVDACGRDVPTYVLKIPTGGGKTLVAVKAIDAIQSAFLKRKTGLVLWVVPTEEIFEQTLRSLRDRSHPYRQHLDMASGGRTLVKRKLGGRIDRFTPLDVAENLVVYVMMLQSAAREELTQKDLRIFMDSGGFAPFFPDADRLDEHADLLVRVPNLTTYPHGTQHVVKTSLGNTFALLSPLVILDESQKAYSDNAQRTIYGFNPACVVELSATPPAGSSVLVEISGRELCDEGMIKLDLHVHNRARDPWQGVVRAVVEKRAALEEEALKLYGKTGTYIRPIALLQAERVGKDQEGKGFIHSNDVKAELSRLGVPDAWIAIKTAETNELRPIADAGGLLARECEVRFIITKHALQEGWDCPFAYVLGVLAKHSNASDKALTQLVGRVLRQPYATKTGVRALDESYVYAWYPTSHALLESISAGFKGEGLTDIAHRIFNESDDRDAREDTRSYPMRKEFARAARRILLPFFLTKQGSGWRKVEYERDILPYIPWADFDVSALASMTLSDTTRAEDTFVVRISDDGRKVIHGNALAVESTLSAVYPPVTVASIAAQLVPIVPNPWMAEALAAKLLTALHTQHDARIINANGAYIADELARALSLFADTHARAWFTSSLEKGKVRLAVAHKEAGYAFPHEIEVRPIAALAGIQKSLFDVAGGDGINGMEKDVVYFLDRQEKLYFWYRNEAKEQYGMRGWRRGNVYADFIFTVFDPTAKKVERVYILETKGDQLAGSDDTEYKRELFDMANARVRKMSKQDLDAFGVSAGLTYRLVKQSEWRREMEELFGSM